MLRTLRIAKSPTILAGIRSKATMANPAPASSALSSQQIFDREDKYGAHNYHPLPVALCRGKGEKYIMHCYLIYKRIIIIIYFLHFIFVYIGIGGFGSVFMLIKLICKIYEIMYGFALQVCTSGIWKVGDIMTF